MDQLEVGFSGSDMDLLALRALGVLGAVTKRIAIPELARLLTMPE